jgi:hypothetical protein
MDTSNLKRVNLEEIPEEVRQYLNTKKWIRKVGPSGEGQFHDRTDRLKELDH